MICRHAVVSEQLALEALQRRASLNNPGDREALLGNPDAIEVPLGQIVAGHVFVAEREGAIVGFAAVIPRDDGDAELDALFVEPSDWKQGVGRLLVEHCANVALMQGSAALHVIGNPHAEGFYRACGFEQTGTVQTRFGVALCLRKTLRGCPGRVNVVLEPARRVRVPPGNTKEERDAQSDKRDPVAGRAILEEPKR